MSLFKTRSFGDGHQVVVWGNSRGGTAFDDRAELVRRFPARQADEYRMCAIECILEGRALAQVGEMASYGIATTEREMC